MYHYTWGVQLLDPMTQKKVWEWDKRAYVAAMQSFKIPIVPMPPPVEDIISRVRIWDTILKHAIGCLMNWLDQESLSLQASVLHEGICMNFSNDMHATFCGLSVSSGWSEFHLAIWLFQGLLQHYPQKKTMKRELAETFHQMLGIMNNASRDLPTLRGCGWQGYPRCPSDKWWSQGCLDASSVRGWIWWLKVICLLYELIFNMNIVTVTHSCCWLVYCINCTYMERRGIQSVFIFPLSTRTTQHGCYELKIVGMF